MKMPVVRRSQSRSRSASPTGSAYDTTSWEVRSSSGRGRGGSLRYLLTACSSGSRSSCTAPAYVGSAGAAGTEDLQSVTDLGVPVRCCDRPGPLLHGRSLDLDGCSAGAADEVVVMGVAAAAVDALAGLRAQ